MRFAYADPPYIGQARKHYGCPEVDHGALIERLFREYPNGWALSCSTPSLFALIPLILEVAPIPHGCRIAGWFKPFASFKRGVNPAYAWEPVIWRGGRKRDRTEPTVRDWVSASITLKKGLAGAKPHAFCDWVMDLLGTQEGDEWDDLFPGTGVFGARWKARQLSLGVA